MFVYTNKSKQNQSSHHITCIYCRYDRMMWVCTLGGTPSVYVRPIAHSFMMIIPCADAWNRVNGISSCEMMLIVAAAYCGRALHGCTDSWSVRSHYTREYRTAMKYCADKRFIELIAINGMNDNRMDYSVLENNVQ